jgi:hypothetical protein
MAGGVTNSIGLVINSSNPVSSLIGGTGVSNSFPITVAGSFTTSGANSLTLTTTGSTNVTLPTSGTLVNNAVTTLSSLVSIGTITTGIWNGTIIGAAYGGTGIANSSTMTWTASNNITWTTTGTTSLTLPTSGTLATTASGVSTTNVTGTSATMTASGAINIFTANNAGLVTLTLPSTFSIGQVFRVVGVGAGGWKIAQVAGQSVNYESGGATAVTTTGTGGSLSSGLATDCIDLVATVANTTLTVTSVYGSSISGV